LNEPWYERSFREDYLLVYKHRDQAGAANEVRTMSEWLQLPAGAKVLDLCCGSGRHSIVLDKLGLDVTGVDLSETLLAEARTNSEGCSIRWQHGDMRNVPLEGETFDAVLNMFTSFGYFDNDAENERVLGEIARLLREGGQFIIDFLNPSFIEANLVPHSVREDGAATIDETRAIQDGYVVKTIRIQDKESDERVYEERVKLYRLASFRSMLERAGLTLERVFGGYDGTDYEEAGSPRLIMMGTKRRNNA
jgi:SAM-dependent methyltransferase